MKHFKNIYIVVGKSGTGKTTITEELSKINTKYSVVQSYTTRPQRYKNEYGHIFVSKKEFDALENKCAYVKYSGAEYCATSEQVDNACFYILDPTGMEYFKEHYIGYKKPVIIYLTAPRLVRIKRMLKSRGDSIFKVLQRLRIDRKWFYGMELDADFVLDTDRELSETMYAIRSFIEEQEQITN